MTDNRESQNPPGQEAGPERKGGCALSAAISTLSPAPAEWESISAEDPTRLLAWPTELDYLRDRHSRPWTPPAWSVLPEVDAIGEAAGRFVLAAQAAETASNVGILRREASAKTEHSPTPSTPIRTIPTRRGCSHPVGLVTVDPATGAISTLLAPCKKPTCPECRRFDSEAWTCRMLTAFEDRSMYRLEVSEDRWPAFLRKVERLRQAGADVQYQQVPAFGGVRVVFCTEPVEASAELVTDPGRQVLETLEMRPLRDRRRVCGTRGFVPEMAALQAGQVSADPAPDLDTVELVGFWNPREGIRQAAAAAAEVGIRVRRFNPTLQVLGGFELQDLDWRRDRHRPELVRFLRNIAFQAIEEDSSGRVPLAGDWKHDPLLHAQRGHPDDPPMSSYTEPPLDWEEQVA